MKQAGWLLGVNSKILKDQIQNLGLLLKQNYRYNGNETGMR